MNSAETTEPLETIAANLLATGPATLPFGGGDLRVRSFLLERDAGNLLIYGTPGLADAVPSLSARGPVARHYLGHSHEAMFLTDPADAVDAPLVVHEDDRPAAAEQAAVQVHTFSKRHHTDPDFEVIPIPGHTAGSAAFLWDSGERRYLFTADSIYVHQGKWRAGLLESSDRSAFVESLELIEDLEFDALVPWVADADAPAVTLVDPEEARARVGALVEWLRS